MTELLTAAQMRAIEQAAMKSGEVTGLALMEGAGRGVVEAVLEEWPAMALTSHKAVVLCGPGNNGGDGFVVARLLKERGWEVEVFLYGDEEKLPVDAKANCERWLEMGEVKQLAKISFDNVSDFSPDLFVDALFGTGLTRAISLDLYKLLEVMWFQTIHHKIVSIDVLSGLDANSGRFMIENVDEFNLVCDLTVTFHRPKIGHHLAQHTVEQGKIVNKDIGLDRAASEFEIDESTQVELLGEDDEDIYGYGYNFAGVDKESWFTENHKYSHGHALILSGPSGKTGAARLAARGALRIGAGVVTVACPPDALAENAAQLNAIMLKRVADATELNAVLQDERINALCLGPALGLEDDRAELVREALTVREDHAQYGLRKIVLDADALTLLAQDTELFGMLHENCVLTPHAGEFARLFPDIAAKLAEPATGGPAYSKVDATRDAAKRAGCVVLYKGADTVIADFSSRVSINSAHYERSAPWLATAGSGDVLAGFITGLMARGFGPMQAAETAAWLHVECALNFGRGLIAEDIPEQLPKVFSKLSL